MKCFCKYYFIFIQIIKTIIFLKSKNFYLFVSKYSITIDYEYSFLTLSQYEYDNDYLKKNFLIDYDYDYLLVFVNLSETNVTTLISYLWFLQSSFSCDISLLFRHSIAHGIKRKQLLLDTKLKMINEEES
jgi:hypothetical protein